MAKSANGGVAQTVVTIRTLWFECEPRPFHVPKHLRCHTATVGNLTIEEYRLRSTVLPYGLRMSTRLSAREDVQARVSEAIKLAGDLNVVWTYAALRPLFHQGLIVKFLRSPPGWTTNARAVKQALPHTRASLEIRWRRQGYQGFSATLDEMPLAPALAVLTAYRAAGDVARSLVALHVQALEMRGTQAGLFLFAKALELGRALLAGPGDSQKQRNLQPEIQARLRHSLGWLMGIANQRLDVRHIVENPRTLKLHPRLSVDERKKYVHDADLILRGIIAQQLNIRLMIADEQ